MNLNQLLLFIHILNKNITENGIMNKYLDKMMTKDINELILITYIMLTKDGFDDSYDKDIIVEFNKYNLDDKYSEPFFSWHEDDY